MQVQCRIPLHSTDTLSASSVSAITLPIFIVVIASREATLKVLTLTIMVQLESFDHL